MSHATKCAGKDYQFSPELCDCDGYHTFAELYEHRIELYIALCRNLNPEHVRWRSFYHSDGTEIEDWFLLGINLAPGKQITYHLPNKYWDACGFAVVLDTAPIFDGHTSDDVLERLKTL